MMPIGTPRVPYRNPTEGTWQWVDLWNALVSELITKSRIDDQLIPCLTKLKMFTYKYLSFNTNYVFNRSTSPIRALSRPMENFGCVISTHFGVFVLLKNLLTS